MPVCCSDEMASLVKYLLLVAYLILSSVASHLCVCSCGLPTTIDVQFFPWWTVHQLPASIDVWHRQLSKNGWFCSMRFQLFDKCLPSLYSTIFCNFCKKSKVCDQHSTIVCVMSKPSHWDTTDIRVSAYSLPDSNDQNSGYEPTKLSVKLSGDGTNVTGVENWSFYINYGEKKNRIIW